MDRKYLLKQPLQLFLTLFQLFDPHANEMVLHFARLSTVLSWKLT